MKKIILFFIVVTATMQIHAQTAAKGSGTVVRGGFGIWSFDIGYLASGNAKNYKESKPLFASNGYAAALNYRWGDRYGIAGKASYTGGKTSEKNAQTYASSLVTTPFTAKIAGLKTNWSQFNIAAGPSVMLGKNFKGEISAVGGVGFGSGNTVTIDKYDAQTKVGTIFTATEKKVKPFWEVGVGYQVADISKRSALGIKASYGANGGIIGLVLQIADSDCHNVICYRCPGAGCIPK